MCSVEATQRAVIAGFHFPPVASRKAAAVSDPAIREAQAHQHHPGI